MNTGDIIQLRVAQTSHFDRSVESVFFYRLTGGAGSLQSCATAFWDYVGLDWLNLCQNTHTFDTIFARNLFNEAEFFNLTVNEVGGELGNIGEPLPDFVALDVRFPRQSGNIRDGRKRILCGGEGVLDDGVWNTAWLTTWVSPFIVLLDDVITDTTPDPDATYAPVVVKRIFTGLSPKGRRLYRLPENQAEADYYQIANVLASGNPTSQVSRK